jgi:signal transduction histidine kinase
MATRPSLKFRTLLTLIATTLAALALLAAGALLVLATVLHQTSASLGGAVASVHLAEEAENDLLVHQRTADPLVRSHLEESIRTRLREAHQYTSTNREAIAVAEAERTVEAYLQRARPPADAAPLPRNGIDAAYNALENLVTINADEARDARARADRWDRLGTLLGICTSVLLLTLTGWLLFWVWTRAFQPMFALSRAMNRFAHGDRGARVDESGPGELRAMAQRFNELADALAAQREAQMAFLAGVAHDLRNPLSALKLSVATIRPDAPLPAEPRIRRTLNTVDRQLTRIERMLGDLIDTAKTEAGQLDLQMEPQDARVLVEHVVELFESVAMGQVIELRLPSEPVVVCCDALRIEQVIGNLVSNAIKYSPGAALLRVTVEKVGDEAIIEVSDHGIGIPEEEQSLLFEPFRRGRASADGPPGVGLGLFVARRIIEGHGGRIELDSAPGHGSTFRIFLALEHHAVPRPEATDERRWVS